MAEVFPQDLYPFPRDSIVDRWRSEIDDSAIDCSVATDDAGARLIGFAATTGRELLHFGTAIETRGEGVASELLDVIAARRHAISSRPGAEGRLDRRRRPIPVG